MFLQCLEPSFIDEDLGEDGLMISMSPAGISTTGSVPNHGSVNWTGSDSHAAASVSGRGDLQE